MRHLKPGTASTCLAGLLLMAQPAVGAEAVDFDRDIRPILASKCYSCHGPDAEARQAGLRLDSFEGATAALESGEGQAVAPGALNASVLWHRIVTEDQNERMPPANSNNQVLSPQETALLRHWIEAGAAYKQHWAYRPIRRPAPPRFVNSWIRNPIDQFIYRRLEVEQLSPAAEADARTLMRRLSLDLTGLPPTYEQIQVYRHNSDPDAYEHQVAQLLASAHYGERMAVRWLDLVRYADTAGYHGDLPMSVSPFRDYVIEAFNSNMPFDQFTREHLAGDLLAARDGVTPPDGLRMRIASGYNRLSMMSGTMVPPEVNLAKYSAERVRNLSLVWMGATVGCAECHDHKFDPYTAEDFYSLASFFADVKEKGVYNQPSEVVKVPHTFGDWGPSVAVPTPAQAASLREFDGQIDALKRQLADTGSLESVTEEQPISSETRDSPESASSGGGDEPGVDSAKSAPPESTASNEVASLKAQLERLIAKREAIFKTVTTTNVTVSVTPREMRILPRGNSMDKSGKVVQPAIPRYFGSLATSGRATRLDLADWLVSPDNPLTARVAMNRLWYIFFGRGLSPSLDDFGRQGAAPSHPELLDWLAAEFIESGWDLKHMVRLIVTSATYRQSSASNRQQRDYDPYNSLLSHQSRFRLDAEFIRDNALSVSGLLIRRIGGRSVYPYQPDGYYAHLNFPKREYPTSQGEDLWRRSTYTHWQRQYLHPSLMAFDAPAREECTVERPRSNTPLAALVLLNDPIYVEASRVFAERVLTEGPSDARGRVAYAYRRALGRAPRERELNVLVALEHQYLDQFRHDRAAATALISVGARPVPSGLDLPQLAAWTGLARVIFNSHEFITRD